MVEKQNVGIDSAKDKFDTCFMYSAGESPVIKGTRSFLNTEAGREKFLAWVVKKSKQGIDFRFTIEATGVYHEELVYFLVDKGYHVSVVLPNMSKAYGKSLNLKSKNDKVDAMKLAMMGLERDLAAFNPGIPELRRLKKIMRYRQGLIKEKTMIGNRLHAEGHSYNSDKLIIDAHKTAQESLNESIALAEQWAEEIVDKDLELKRKVENIMKVRGLGFVTVVTVIAETDGFHLFKNRAQLTSFAGYDVVENQSGQFSGKQRISKKGNSFIRSALYFPSISVTRWEPRFKALFDRVFKRRKVKMMAYVAVQRKLLILIYTLYTKDLIYISDYGMDKNENEELEKLKEAIKNYLEKSVGSTSLATVDDIVTNISLLV